MCILFDQAVLVLDSDPREILSHEYKEVNTAFTGRNETFVAPYPPLAGNG